jgi:hypothetical protein
VTFVTDEGSRTILRGHCPNCDAERNAAVLAEDTIEEEDKPSGVWGKSTYSILRCLGCDKRYIRLVELCSEDWDYDVNPDTGETSLTLNERVTYWPSVRTPRTTRARPDWLWFDPLERELRLVDLAGEYPELTTLLSELYAALDKNLQILAAIGIRTVFDCASQLLGCNPNQSFPEKLKELTAGNKISGEEKEILSVLTDAGSAAAHRGWKPPQDDINSLMDALEGFLHRTFVLKHELRRVKKNIPPRAIDH